MMDKQTEQSKLTAFIAQIGVEISDLELLKEALTHRSYAHEVKPLQIKHNERLEFLGDAVLELIITEYLYTKYPERAEGELTSFRAALVRKESLAETAIEMNYGEFLYMSKGEEHTGGRKRAYILANAYEAVLGAIYLNKGLETCQTFVLKHLAPKLDKIVSERLDIDPKSKLQEIVQELVKVTPHYELASANGPDHNKQFQMALFIGDKQVAVGEGRSKQEAEQNAAQHALENWDQIYSNSLASAKIHDSK
jgi:ribonuclease-3